MSELGLQLIEAYRSGNFLKAVNDARYAETVSGSLASEISALHNSGAIDVVAAFKALENTPGIGLNFYVTLYVFTLVLPNIESSVESIMATVIHLQKAAGTDLAAGMILDSFAAFSAKDPARPATALRAIEADPAQYADLLPATLIAGSQLDGDLYHSEAVRVLRSGVIGLRQRAAFALGNMAAPSTPAVSSASLAAL